MKTIEYTITDEMGLHARVAGKLVKKAAGFGGQVRMGTPQKMVNGKGIVGVMMLALKQGDTLTIELEGEGEEQFAAQMLQLLEETL